MNGLVSIVGAVPAGFPSPAADYIEETIDLNKHLITRPSATLLVRVQGDSMKDAAIPPGALLVVDRSITASSGHIIIAVVNGEFTVKRLIRTHAGVFLAPENPNYKSIHIKDGMEMSVWGVVTYIITDARTV